MIYFFKEHVVSSYYMQKFSENLRLLTNNSCSAFMVWIACISIFLGHCLRFFVVSTISSSNWSSRILMLEPKKSQTHKVIVGILLQLFFFNLRQSYKEKDSFRSEIRNHMWLSMKRKISVSDLLVRWYRNLEHNLMLPSYFWSKGAGENGGTGNVLGKKQKCVFLYALWIYNLTKKQLPFKQEKWFICVIYKH